MAGVRNVTEELEGTTYLSNVSIRNRETAVIACIARPSRTGPLAARKSHLLLLLWQTLLLIRIFLIHIVWWAAGLC